MEITDKQLVASELSVDNESKTDELEISIGETNNLSIIQGKRAKDTLVYLDDNTVLIKSKSKFFWTTDEVKVKNVNGRKVDVESSGEGYRFTPLAGTSYLVTIVHKVRILLILLLAILLLLGISIPVLSARLSKPAINITPEGQYEVGEKRDLTEEQEESVDNNTITFSGYGKFTVSENQPDVELSNPSNNFVNMQYTLIDDASGKTIASTGLISPGNYVYVNVMNFYRGKTGEFNTTIKISTFTDEGQQMNGMTEKMLLVIK